jgi:TrmH family RNA methyltransferase
MEVITSAQNSLIKLVRSLERRKQRDETGLFVAEGIDYALKAKAYRFEPRLLLVDRDHAADSTLTEIVTWASEEHAKTIALPPSLLTRVSSLSNPQTLILVCLQRWQSRDIQPAGNATVLALDSIHDSGNLGTIIRTAEAAGVRRLYLIEDFCDPFSPEAVRASAGSIFAMDITAATRSEFKKTMKNWPGDVVGTHLKASESFRQPYKRPVLLLMGSESHGLPEDLTAACTKLVRIPMAPDVESLNIAAATALMLYELQLPHLLRHSRA